MSPSARDVWVDAVLGIEGVPDDGADLPRGCVPYLPCAVSAVIAMVDAAVVSAEDVFVDVGAGVGRAAITVGLLTGATVVGVEVQRGLAARARTLASALPTLRMDVVVGDVADHIDDVSAGTVFFLYCPFSGVRLEAFVDGLAGAAAHHPIRIASVDTPLPTRPWLTSSPTTTPALSVRHSKRGLGS